MDLDPWCLEIKATKNFENQENLNILYRNICQKKSFLFWKWELFAKKKLCQCFACKYQIYGEHEEWYFVTKIVQTYCEKNCSSDIGCSRPKAEYLQIFDITRRIYSNSEMSEEFLVTECFFLNCSWRFLISNKLQQLDFKLEKNIGI